MLPEGSDNAAPPAGVDNAQLGCGGSPGDGLDLKVGRDLNVNRSLRVLPFSDSRKRRFGLRRIAPPAVVPTLCYTESPFLSLPAAPAASLIKVGWLRNPPTFQPNG